jgi:DNA polymerase-3 subunit delta'
VLVPEQWRERLGLSAADEEGAEAGEGGTAGAGKGKAAGREIRVGDVRAAIDWAQRTSSRGGPKVLVLHPAQRLNLIAANALLKTLEEPPGALRLVLCCEDPQALLPTVRSRCQMLGLGLPDAAAAVSWLQSVGVEDAPVLLQAAGGRPAQALELAQEGISARLWPEMPELVRQGRADAFAALAVPRVIETLQKMCLDLLNRARRQPSRYFPQESLPQGAQAEALLVWWSRLQRAARHREHPWNASLLVESLVLQGRDCWPSRQDRTPSSRHVR